MADEDKKVEFSEEQQALVDRLVGDARVKARDKAQAELTDKAAKEQEATEQAALVASKEWQKLAEKHGARVKELEPLEGKAKEFDKLVEGMLEDKIKALGEAATKAVKALPETLATIDKLNWLSQNEELFQAGDGVGTPGRPRTKSGKTRTAKEAGHTPLKM